MAFFFEYAPTNELGVADMMKDLRTGFLCRMLNGEMREPIMRVGNTIIVHFLPEWDAMIDYYVKYGIAIAPGQIFKVTRLYPWNHPSDIHARAAWKEDQQQKMEDVAELTGTTKYYDDMGRPVPPPPKLVRTTNSYDLKTPIDTRGYFDLWGMPLSQGTSEWDYMYDSDDSMPALESVNSGGMPSRDDLDYSPLAPFSPRGSTTSPVTLPDPLIL